MVKRAKYGKTSAPVQIYDYNSKGGWVRREQPPHLQQRRTGQPTMKLGDCSSASPREYNPGDVMSQ
jgi:hypothetical protein